MNVTLLNAVADQLEKHPETYDQTHWSEDEKIEGHCGTRACIAGHACHEAVFLGLAKVDTGCDHIRESARRLLDLPPQFCEILFDMEFVAPNHDTVKFLRRIAAGEDLQLLTVEIMEQHLMRHKTHPGYIFFRCVKFCENEKALYKFWEHFSGGMTPNLVATIKERIETLNEQGTY